MGVNQPRIVQREDRVQEPSRVPKNVARRRPASLAEYDPLELALRRARRDIEDRGGRITNTRHGKGKVILQYVSRNGLPRQKKVSLGPRVVG